MKKKRTIRSIIFWNMALIALVSLGLTNAIWLLGQYNEFKAETSSIRKEHVDAQKEIIKQEVSTVVSYVDNMKAQTEKSLMESIRARTNEAIKIAANIYRQNKDSQKAHEIKKMIKDALRPVRFNDGRGYYFAFNLEGVEELFPDRPDLEGTNMLSMQGGKGEYVVRDMLEIVKSKGEGFYRYTWTKPGQGKKYFPKIAFVKLFEPYDWVIGCGEYIDDVEAQIKREVIERLVGLRFGKEGYFFGSTYDGDSLFSNGKITIGDGNILGLTDPKGVKIIQEQIRAAQQTDGGFVSYVWKKLDLASPLPKISYVLSIPEWRWVIGTGVYLDTIEAQIKSREQKLKAGFQWLVAEGIIILLAFIALTFLLANRHSKRIGVSLTAFGNFFRQAVTDSTPIDTKGIYLREFDEIAEAANEMLRERQKTMEALSESEDRFKALSEESPLGVSLIDKQGRYKYINPAFIKMFGYTLQDLKTGKDWFNLAYPDEDYRKAVLKAWDEDLNQHPQGESRPRTYGVRCKGGSSKTILFRPVTLASHDQFVLYEDITERKKAEDQLQKSEQKYRQLFEESPISLWEQDFSAVKKRMDELELGSIDDLRGYLEAKPAVVRELANLVKVVDVNQATMQLYRAKNKKQLLDKITNVFVDESYPEFMEAILTIAKGGEHATIEKVHKTLDGQIIDVELHRSLAPGHEDGYSRVLVSIVDITDRKQREKALQASHGRFLTVMNSIDASIYVADMDSHEILFMNRNMIEDFGDDMTGKKCWEVFRGESQPCSHCRNNLLVKDKGEPAGLLVWQDENPVTGKWYINHDRAIEWMDGRLVKLQIATDITELKRMEEELRQAQKMEAVGTLAGGIAHDFNNILATIIGYSELALDDAKEGKATPEELELILESADRAKGLVKQILAFSRKMTFRLEPLDLNKVITKTVGIIERTIPKMISVRVHLEEKLWLISGDHGQIEQVLLNLTSNARDAMPQGGELVIETANFHLGTDCAEGYPEMPPGDYVLVTFSDTGEGMDKEALGHIFDPFFTTKDVGKGTGLGLSSAYGIVKSHAGFIICSSEPGKGATFKMYFPALESDSLSGKALDVDADIIKGGMETILLVDDEQALRRLGSHALRSKGYRVLTAASGEEALEIYRERGEEVDLAILDLGMPGMGGKQALKEILAIRPQAKVIIATGYLQDGQIKGALKSGASGYVAKPFRRFEFLTTVRQVLDQK